MICSHGIKSTIKSLDPVLDPVINRTCQLSEVCGVAMMKIKYGNETGQGKIGNCVPNSFCSDTAGCQLTTFNLPPNVTFQECKVLFFKQSALIFLYLLYFNFQIQVHIRKRLLWLDY